MKLYVSENCISVDPSDSVAMDILLSRLYGELNHSKEVVKGFKSEKANCHCIVFTEKRFADGMIHAYNEAKEIESYAARKSDNQRPS